MNLLSQYVLRAVLLLVLPLFATSVGAVTPRIAAGQHHTAYLKSDGSVWTSGTNNSGRLGDGTMKWGTQALQRVPGLAGVIDVAVGPTSTLAVTKNGRVMAWGSNGDTQLGDGTSIDRPTPIAIPGLTNAIAVSMGRYHGLALRGDGTVWSWGINSNGQLGDGSQTDRPTAAAVPSLAGIVAIASGSEHNLALKSDGTVWAWGFNLQGQLGDNSIFLRTAPVQVSGLSGIVAISAGHSHSMALKNDGTVWTWGWNGDGELADGTVTSTSRLVPGVVPGLTGVTAIEAGQTHGLALKSDKSVWAWGANHAGQLGIGSANTTVGNPTQIDLPKDVVGIGSGYYVSFLMRADGSVWACGQNPSGQLGDGTRGVERRSPVQMLNTQGVIDVAAGAHHSLMLRDDGTVWAWGAGDNGQLGDSTNTGRGNPFRVIGLAGVRAIGAGSYHSLAVGRDGSVWAWGDNSTGQLGNGSTVSSDLPVKVTGLVDVIAVSGGAEHSVAVKRDGTVWAWGGNSFGQLGDNTNTMRTTPVQVGNLSNIAYLASGLYHNLAINAVTGMAWAWGANTYGQIGDGTTNDRKLPIAIRSAMAVAAGAYHSLSMDVAGTAWAWGLNLYGQLGDGSTTQRTTPVAVSGLASAQSIAAGGFHSLARNISGVPLAWGKGGSGELGGGAWANASTPANMSGTLALFPGAMAAGMYHSIVVNANGVALATGDNSAGQLGDGSGSFRYAPVPVDDLFPANAQFPTGWADTMGSYAPWGVEVGSPFAGPASLDSGAIGNSAHSGVRYSANFRDGFATFQYRVTSEAGFDWLRLYVDGVKQGEWSGDTGWQHGGAFLKAGVHEIAWKYEKNGSVTGGDDAAWIDSVTLPIAFSDVAATHWAFDHIHALKDAGITTGCGSGNYCPGQNVTREQMAAFIIRAVEGEPAACSAAPFTDVPTGNAFCKYVKRMLDLNITTGCGSGNYCPSQNVTREQMAAFIVRAVEGNPPANYCGSTAPFGDVPVGNTFCGHIKRLSELGITTGCGGGNYCPTQLVTRDQMAAFLGRAFLGM